MVAILLLIMAEEDAFWLLAAIVEDVLPGFYHPSLIGVNTDTNVLHDLIAIKLPDVWESLQTLQVFRRVHCGGGNVNDGDGVVTVCWQKS